MRFKDVPGGRWFSTIDLFWLKLHEEARTETGIPFNAVDTEGGRMLWQPDDKVMGVVDVDALILDDFLGNRNLLKNASELTNVS